MLKRFKIWYLKQLLKLCNYGLKFKDGADNQNEINDVVEIRNRVIRDLEREANNEQ